MKIYYFVNSRLPTEKAHGIQITHMCNAFSNNIELELVVPDRVNAISTDIFSYYSLPNNFKINKIACFDFIKHFHFLGNIALWLQNIQFAHKALKINISKDSIIYTRNPELAYYFKKHKNNKIIFESHGWPNRGRKIYKKLALAADKIIVISSGIKKQFIDNGFEEKNILIARDGVDLSKFKILNKDESKRSLGLSQEKKCIVYTGSLQERKGVFLLADTAIRMSEYNFYFVGGTDSQILLFKNRYSQFKNIHTVGFISYKEIPNWLSAADLLIIPNSGNNLDSSTLTSPMKLFEYMSSKRPIIASKVPSLQEVLKENCEYFEPDSIESLTEAIKKSFNSYDPDSIDTAFEEVKKYQWTNRASNILDFIAIKNN